MVNDKGGKTKCNATKDSLRHQHQCIFSGNHRLHRCSCGCVW